ncbi:acyltransferase [Neorhizobium lilium]|uniref:Acyltransferase n=1 Tax=Neorhizobium lilium TaxID=2503024 RepID=A0A3S4URJ5_9HYPH|nr:acyltransferase [Neorhizobium lilium]RWX79326.1 acyltransferase [Neorhizobium lilium]
MPTLYSIQYLRALAALAVVVFHAGERGGLHFTIGAAGVDVFFVVSGFIMMAISDSRPTRPMSFLRNRLLRIAPSYWAATAVMLLGAVIGLFPNLRIGLTHTLASFLFIPMQSPSNGEMWPVLVQGWTLNYEIFFYVVFAATLFARPGLRLALLGSIFGLLTILGMLFRPADPLVAFYTAPVILEFVAGAVIAKLWQRGALPPASLGAVMAVLALAGFATIQILRMEFGPWTCGPLAVMLVIGALAIETRGKLPQFPALAYLGDSSYSIYLWHTFAISVALKAAGSLPPTLLLIVCVIIGTLAGILAYEGLERPLQFLLRGKRSSLWRFPIRRRA